MPLNIFKSSMDISMLMTLPYLISSANWNEIPKLQEALLEDLQKVEKWSRTNSMYSNPSKTKAILAVGKRLRKRFDGETSSLQLSLNDKEIKIVRSDKLLGLKIDQDLTYDQSRSQPDNLVPLCKFQSIIIIYFFRN